jgi:hypothetical protein
MKEEELMGIGTVLAMGDQSILRLLHSLWEDGARVFVTRLVLSRGVLLSRSSLPGCLHIIVVSNIQRRCWGSISKEGERGVELCQGPIPRCLSSMKSHCQLLLAVQQSSSK